MMGGGMSMPRPDPNQIMQKYGMMPMKPMQSTGQFLPSMAGMSAGDAQLMQKMQQKTQEMQAAQTQGKTLPGMGTLSSQPSMRAPMAPEHTMMQGPSARQGLVGPLQSMMQRAPGRPVGTATGMGMTPPSQGAFNPIFNNLNRGGGMPFNRQNADGIMRKYRMGGAM